MTFPTYRHFIATISALAIAITGFSAAPARANDNDAAKALAVILGLAVVGTAIKNRNDDKKSRQQVHKPHHQQVYRPHHQQYAKPHHVQPRKGHVQKHHEPRHQPRHVSRNLLPQQCLYNLKTEHGRHFQGFGHHCLTRNYQFTNALPQECGTRVWTRSGLGYAYGAHCLNQYGYQLARR